MGDSSNIYYIDKNDEKICENDIKITSKKKKGVKSAKLGQTGLGPTRG